MTKAVIAARRAAGVPAHQPAAATGADVIYRKLFDSFNPDKDGRISHWEVLARLQRSGLQPDDPRIAPANWTVRSPGIAAPLSHQRSCGKHHRALRQPGHPACP